MCELFESDEIRFDSSLNFHESYLSYAKISNLGNSNIYC